MEKFINLLPLEDKEKQFYHKQAFFLSTNTDFEHEYTHEFFILPMSCPRPRFAKFGRPYMPKKYMDWKKELVKLMDEIPLQNLDGSVELKLEFYFYNEKKPWGIHKQKPDIDNLIKAFCDSAVDANILVDDDQIYSIKAKKFWGYEPKIIMKIKY